MSSVPVTCPTCFEEFEVAPPALQELPASWDYDCEVCCHPMVIDFEADDGEVYAHARSLVE